MANIGYYNPPFSICRAAFRSTFVPALFMRFGLADSWLFSLYRFYRSLTELSWLAKLFFAHAFCWLASYLRPVGALRYLSASLFGAYGKMAVYARRRFARLAYDGPPSLRLAV